MYFPDLGTKTQIDDSEHVRAVGWLSAQHPFTNGEVPAAFASRLRLICSNWGEGIEQLWWPVVAGIHTCELCGKFSSGGNIGIPAGPLLFVAPEMVCHYVDVHSYKPPDEFVAAVLNCPLPGSEEYGRAVAAFRQIKEERLRSMGLGR